LSTSSKDSTKGFSYLRSRLGLGGDDTVEELSVPSPFAYEDNCVLYVPRDLPPPGSEAFLDQSAERISELVKSVDGGAFVLTTSVASMRGLHARLRKRLDARLLLLQGERPKDALLSAFRANGAGVLVATSSFWEGVDVPGEALRLVVLEKIPFAVPSDPVFQARGRALEEAGKSSFAHLALPGAAITLKQGFGRLIRREDDVGIVALLDERVHTKGYGKRIISALPAAHRTSSLDDVKRFVARWPRKH
jgi:ATP-dependent DNA helicase DinG